MNKKFFKILSTLVLIFAFVSNSVFAIEYPNGNTYEAEKAGWAQSSSSNGFTQAKEIFKGTDGKYYLAVASRDGVNEMDSSFKAAVNAAVAAGQFEGADYIYNNTALTVKIDGKTYISKTPSEATGKGSNVWVILSMTYEKLISYKNSDGLYEIPVISAGGFALKAIKFEIGVVEEPQKTDYSLKYDLQGGIGNIENPTFSDTAESAVFKITDVIPYKEGYKFSGWATKPNADAPDIADTVTVTKEEKEKTVYAVWAVNSYKVVYKVDGVQVGETEVYEYGKPVTVRDKFTKAGYTVSDWSIKENFNMPARDVEITATTKINSYKVVYKVDGVQVGETEVYEYGKPVTVRDKFTKAGYTVSDWSIKENFNMPARDVEITATTKINSYKVIFEVNLPVSTPIPPQQIQHGNKAELPNVSLDNYNFDGWYTDKDYTQKFDKETMIYKDTVLYAKLDLLPANSEPPTPSEKPLVPETGESESVAEYFLLMIFSLGIIMEIFANKSRA